jgi:hypothetical protein
MYMNNNPTRITRVVLCDFFPTQRHIGGKVKEGRKSVQLTEIDVKVSVWYR